ncbi:hypothetical protein BT69DRAFT_352909 [Atractiella rhizophila]|nr:hypothetical protein BT69DRAFT_352909 [Atractiella rhizophila]
MFRDEKLNPLPIFKMSQKGSMDDRLASRPVPEPMLVQLRQLKKGYDTELETLMARYNCTEAELVSGCVLPLPGGLKRLDKDQKLEDPVTTSFKMLQLHYQHLVESRIEHMGPASSTKDKVMEQLALAAYKVSFEELEAGKHARIKKRVLLSFGWMWWKTLVQVVQRVPASNGHQHQPVAPKLAKPEEKQHSPSHSFLGSKNTFVNDHTRRS